MLRYWRTILRSGVIGVFVGILPGVGEDMAAWSSYAAAKRASKEREKFGKGSVEGLIAAETGDNAAIPGALIPALALGIPGSAPAAVLMAAMIIHGVQPGPMLMVTSRSSSTTWSRSRWSRRWRSWSSAWCWCGRIL